MIFILFVLVFVAACTPASVEPTPTPEGPTTIILRNWEGDIDQGILDDFTAETGIEVTYLPYDSQEEAVEAMRDGEVYDVVVLENQLISLLVADGLLAELDYANIPNFKNISANFRDLAYDPGNEHAIPYSWGSTGLVVRTDLVEEPVTGWADLWDERYTGQVMGWPLSRYIIGAALKELGYSLNSEDPAELAEAREQLLTLKPQITLVEWEPAVSAPYLVSGEVVIAMGQADDVIAGQEENEAIQYIMPEEGGILWGDNFTVPANSTHKAEAEQLIDFLLSAEVSARIIEQTYYWLPNDAALELIDPELRANTAIFPTDEMLQNAEVLLSLSPEGEELYQEMWEEFLAAE